MNMEWKTVKLGEVAIFRTGKLDSNAAVIGGKYPFFTCSPLTLAINDYAFDQEAILLAGNNAEGNFNIKYYKGRFNAYQRTYVINPKMDNLDIKYLYYALKICLGKLKTMSQGTSTKFLTVRLLNNFNIPLPSLDTQHRIAAIFSSLDDKIENNHCINANLEAQAHALFKSWFMDFEPWGGVMPDDWKEGVLGEYLIESKEKVGNRNVEEYSVGKLGIRKRSEIYHKQITSTPATNKLLKKGQIVFGMGSGCVDWGVMEDELGATSPAYTVYSISQVIPSDYFKRFFSVNYAKAMDLVKPSVRQGQGLDKGVLMGKYIYIPTKETWSKFCLLYNPLMTQVRTNIEESQRLAQLRDTLLPKLMKGEIEL